VLETLLFSGAAGLITIVGILLLKIGREYALRYSHYINSFAAGLLLATAVAVLLPEAAESVGRRAGLYALGGFTLFLVLETFLVFHSGVEVHYDRRAKGIARGMVFFWGLFLHSLIDGIIIALGFASGRQLGLLMAMAVVSHELPEGITTFSLLVENLEKKAAMRMSVAVALATPLGGVLGLFLRPVVGPDLMGGTIGVVAGSFLYLAAADIVPEIREERPAQNIAALLVGVAFLLAVHHALGH